MVNKKKKKKNNNNSSNSLVFGLWPQTISLIFKNLRSRTVKIDLICSNY